MVRLLTTASAYNTFVANLWKKSGTKEAVKTTVEEYVANAREYERERCIDKIKNATTLNKAIKAIEAGD